MKPATPTEVLRDLSERVRKHDVAAEARAVRLAARQRERELRRARELAQAVRGMRGVDRAVEHGTTIAAVEAIGHFLRQGAPGPSYFVAPTTQAEPELVAA